MQYRKIFILALACLLAVKAQATQALRADSQAVRTKSRTIEKEYSRDMRESRNADSVAGSSALVVEEGFQLPSSQDRISEEPTVGPSKVDPVIQRSTATSGQNSSSLRMTDSFNYPTNLKMRNDRKVGAGLSVG